MKGGRLRFAPRLIEALKGLALFKRAVVFLSVVFIGCTLALAQVDTVLTHADQAVADVRTALRNVQNQVAGGNALDSTLDDLRDSLDGMRSKLQAASDQLTSPLQELQEQTAKLPPAPATGKTEAPEISAQRKLLGDEQGRLAGTQTQIQLLGVEIDQTESQILAQQRDRFFRLIFEPSSSVLSPSLWRSGIEGLQLTGRRIVALFTAAGSSDASANFALPLATLLASLFAVVSIWALAYRRITRRFLQFLAPGDTPNDIARLLRTLWALINVFVLIRFAAFLVVSFLQQTGYFTPKLQLFHSGMSNMLEDAGASIVLIYRLASPSDSRWRLLPIDDQSAKRFTYAACASAVVSAIAGALGKVSDSLYLPISHSIAISAFLSILMLLFMAVANANLHDRDQQISMKSQRFNWASRFRMPVWIVLGVAALALLLGYIAFADYLLFRVFATLVVVAILVLFNYLIDAFSQAAVDTQSPIGSTIRRLTSWSTEGLERAGLFTRTLLDVLLIIVGIPILIAIWAFNWINFRGFFNRIFFSFSIGDVTISPWTVILVITFTVAGVTITKLLVTWLDKRVLTPAHLSHGLQNSVRTGITYAGYVVAAGFALSAVGINLSSLAIIAGALGVGIGFGLQSIVNNFVSGIILLAERPVRVGDWLDTPQGQGIVKRINVRSTTVETFEGCSLVIPNSSFITNTIKNWTLGNPRGVVTVNISVPLPADPDKVKAVMLKTLKDHSKILQFPDPTVTLNDIVNGAMLFAMAGTVADVLEGGAIASDLRASLVKNFNAAGLQFAAPAPAVMVVNGLDQQGPDDQSSAPSAQVVRGKTAEAINQAKAPDVEGSKATPGVEIKSGRAKPAGTKNG